MEATMTTVIEQHREEVAALCRRIGARRLDVFGSAIRDDFDPATSDLDFLVEFDDLSPRAYADAYFNLKESLERLFGRPVDLVIEGSVENPYFRERINAERRPVYAR
jgi:predicted nucleotidyltransferase